MKNRKLIIFSVLAFILSAGFFTGGIWIKERMAKAKAIQKAIANPQHIDPEKLLEEIDSSFRDMPESEKKELLNDPAAIEEHIAEATYRELDKSFKLLFTLPTPLRTKVINESAADLRRKALEKPEEIAEFFDSPAGNGALRGASRFFLLRLSGKEKSESAPLTQAMYEIVKDQAEKKRK